MSTNDNTCDRDREIAKLLADRDDYRERLKTQKFMRTRLETINEQALDHLRMIGRRLYELNYRGF